MILNNLNLLRKATAINLSAADGYYHASKTLASLRKTDGSYAYASSSFSYASITLLRYYSSIERPISQDEFVFYTNADTKSIRGVCDIVIGSGTTPPARADYRLENQITDLAILSTGVYTESYDKAGLSRIFKNVSSAAIDVSEIGVVCRLTPPTPSGSSMSAPPILLTRTVLDTPIVAQPGDIFTVMIDIPY